MDLGRPLQRPDAETGVASDAASTREPDEARIAERRPRSIAQGGFESVLSRIVVLVCLVALVIVTGRLMEPAGRGLYALATVAAARRWRRSSAGRWSSRSSADWRSPSWPSPSRRCSGTAGGWSRWRRR